MLQSPQNPYHPNTTEVRTDFVIFWDWLDIVDARDDLPHLFDGVSETTFFEKLPGSIEVPFHYVFDAGLQCAFGIRLSWLQNGSGTFSFENK